MITRREALAAIAATCGAALPSRSLRAGQTSAGSDGRLRLACGRWLSYREHGHPDKPLVFYFHGTPGSRLEAALCECEASQTGVRLVSVDRPGLGRSSYDGCRRILDWPNDVDELASALGYADKPFGIVGMSGGAPYAAACALVMPHRLRHVAIVSGHTPLGAPGVCPGNQDKMIRLVARRPRLSKRMLRLVARRLDRRPDKVLGKVTKGWTAADRKLVLCDPRLRRDLIANMREAMHCGPAGLVKDIGLLSCPWGFQLCAIQGVSVSIWQGGCDPIVTSSMGRYFHEQIADSELIIDPRAGHVTMFKQHITEILSRFA